MRFPKIWKKYFARFNVADYFEKIKNQTTVEQ